MTGFNVTSFAKSYTEVEDAGRAADEANVDLDYKIYI